MKNESYEFIDDDHLPDVERMRESALGVKDAGPWIIDPLYGFLMDKNCEPIEFYSDIGQPTENLEFISECNPRSVCYLLDQRDTYRELCGDIAKDIDYAILAINNDFGSVELLLEIKAKIEKLLGSDK